MSIHPSIHTYIHTYIHTLWQVLAKKLEVPEEIKMGIEALYFQTWLVVQVGGSMSTAFYINMGVKQGC